MRRTATFQFSIKWIFSDLRNGLWCGVWCVVQDESFTGSQSLHSSAVLNKLLRPARLFIRFVIQYSRAWAGQRGNLDFFMSSNVQTVESTSLAPRTLPSQNIFSLCKIFPDPKIVALIARSGRRQAYFTVCSGRYRSLILYNLCFNNIIFDNDMIYSCNCDKL